MFYLKLKLILTSKWITLNSVYKEFTNEPWLNVASNANNGNIFLSVIHFYFEILFVFLQEIRLLRQRTLSTFCNYFLLIQSLIMYWQK